MADEQQTKREPVGFGEHTRGLPGEYAHEQGWGLDEAERRRQTTPPTDTDGGNEYNYSAQDCGDEPVNMARVSGSADGAEEATRQALGLDRQKESLDRQKEKG